MKAKKLLLLILGVLVVLFLGTIIIKFISGAFSLLSGAIDTILALAVIAAMVIIVIWMFSYTKKNKN